MRSSSSSASPFGDAAVAPPAPAAAARSRWPSMPPVRRVRPVPRTAPAGRSRSCRPATRATRHQQFGASRRGRGRAARGRPAPCRARMRSTSPNAGTPRANPTRRRSPASRPFGGVRAAPRSPASRCSQRRSGRAAHRRDGGSARRAGLRGVASPSTRVRSRWRRVAAFIAIAPSLASTEIEVRCRKPLLLRFLDVTEQRAVRGDGQGLSSMPNAVKPKNCSSWRRPDRRRTATARAAHAVAFGDKPTASLPRPAAAFPPAAIARQFGLERVVVRCRSVDQEAPGGGPPRPGRNPTCRAKPRAAACRGDPAARLRR